jgi:hypothetical protein
MTITVESTQQVTALTMSGNGGTVVGAAVQLIPNQPLSWVYRSTGTTWYPFSGGAGRATALVSGTSVASTSGTSIDFTGIPSWVKRITINFIGTSLSGASSILVQLGAGSVTTTGYTAISNGMNSTGTGNVYSTSGMPVYLGAAASTAIGSVVITLATGTTWISSHSIFSSSITSACGGGALALGGTLDRVRITTVNGTDTFDAGSINILYE